VVAVTVCAGLNNLLAAYDNKSAYAQCTFAYSPGRDRSIEVFVGKTDVGFVVKFLCVNIEVGIVKKVLFIIICNAWKIFSVVKSFLA